MKVLFSPLGLSPGSLFTVIAQTQPEHVVIIKLDQIRFMFKLYFDIFAPTHFQKMDKSQKKCFKCSVDEGL
jgi:hypothetical protein